MDKTETMKRYEAETGEDMPTVNIYRLLDWYKSFSIWLEDKAAAYDRLMSGGKKTLKEWANIFGTPVAVDKNLSGIVFDEIPELLKTVEAWRATHGYVGKIPSLLIDFNGDWMTSLTIPDGWGEK